MEDAVSQYMIRQNRPYGWTDVYANMAAISGGKSKDLTKTGVQAALETLAEKGVLQVRVKGKSKVYFATQPEEVTDNVEDIEKEAANAKSESAKLSLKFSDAVGHLGKLEQRVPLKDIRQATATAEKRLAELKAEKEEIEKKNAESGANGVTSKQDLQRLDRQLGESFTNWRKARKTYNDAQDTVFGDGPKPEEVCPETDSDAGVSLENLEKELLPTSRASRPRGR